MNLGNPPKRSTTHGAEAGVGGMPQEGVCTGSAVAAMATGKQDMVPLPFIAYHTCGVLPESTCIHIHWQSVCK